MSEELTPLQELDILKFLSIGRFEFDFDNIEKALKALDILKDYLYIDKENTLRLRKGKHKKLIGIGFCDKWVIDLLKEILL